MEKYKDTDLREALHRKYAEEPQLPADFMTKMERRMADGSTVPSGSAAGAKHARLWRWVAAAACFLVVVGVGLHFQFKDTPHPIAQSDAPNRPTERTQSSNRVHPVAQSSASNQPTECTHSINRARPVVQSGTSSCSIGHVQSINRARSIDQSSTLDSDPNQHYTSNDLTKDTVPYQDPARVDDYIFQLAEHYQVKQGQLTCSLPVDSSVVSNVYVFPDRDEINLFNRLLQVACWYNSKTPGYHLNFSQQQFFFELQDMRRQLQYRWIAERINGRILFYSTHAPIGVKESSACYQQCRDELMYQNSFNPRTKKL